MNNAVNTLWKASDILRGITDSTSRKKVIVPLVFLKDIERKSDHFDLPLESRWSQIIYQGFPIKDRILDALGAIERRNPIFQGALINDELEKIEEEPFQRLVSLINQAEITSKVFEEILYRFAADEGKKGEFITPQPISELISSLLDIKGGDIYDGAAGTGQLLIEAAKYASSQHAGTVHVWGQEIHKDTWIVGKMNLIIHGIDHEFALGDTLANPAFADNGQLKKFDYVAMNFPFSVKGWGREKAEFDLYKRFSYGIPSDSNGDMAFIQHALASLKEDGKAAVIVTHGTLFRGGADRKIREAMIDDDVIEAVIGLPSNLFYSTGIPTAILILNKNKAPERRGKIQFINAENSFEKMRGQNTLRKEDIDKITSAYRDMERIKQFSTMVLLNEIEDSNLHFGPYFEVDEVESIFGTVQVNRKVYEKSDYPKVELSDLVSMFRGMNTPPKKDLEGNEGDYYFIQLADIQDGNIQFDQLTPIELDSKKARTYEVEEGDIILSSRGAAIKISVVPPTDRKLILSHNFIGMRPKRGVNPHFIKAFLESPIGTYYISSKQKGTAVTVFSVKDIESIPVPAIDSNTQVEIGNAFVKSDEELIKIIEQARQKHMNDYHSLYGQMGLTSAFKPINSDE
ncbi:N-6 DNA methylase [Schinkia azotoformans]|uniref:N-6 DNA methylase n=1 Tax=Schinkia azotoformans TaxID=1454 RepID=UPI002DBA19FC|nr:N-6 DNA methylase [Schinkia azotoformans]MEC1718455.1 N-6 DNA methylase [Schinkia azotoformans]MEC1759829.1 N-6 DNA methylase [Schinkia azotoformans]